MSVLKNRRMILGCFLVYCSGLFSILFLRGIGGQFDFSGYPYWERILDRTNLVPFSTIREQVNFVVHDNYNRRMALRNLTANLLLFAPMGLFLPLLWEKMRKFRKCAALWGVMILTIEALQLLTLQGSFDIDDVLLNSPGFLAGFGVFKLLNVLIREEK